MADRFPNFLALTLSGVISALVGALATAYFGNKHIVEPARERAETAFIEAGEIAGKLEGVQKAFDDAATRLDSASGEKALAKAEVTKLSGELETANNEIADLNRQIEELKRVLGVSKEASTAMAVEEANRKVEESKAKSDRVAELLQPFFTETLSRMVNVRRGYATFVGTTAAMPLSYNAIKAYGALEKGEHGLRLLHELASVHDSKDGGRPNWPTPATEAAWDEVREAQELLRELGDTFVRLGMLEP